MVYTGWLVPLKHLGREIRIELQMSSLNGWLAPLARMARPDAPPVLPEQRIDDDAIVARRKSEQLLASVRHGAVRR